MAAALLLAMIAQYQGYPLLPARRRRQVILSGLPAGSTLGDGRHSFIGTQVAEQLKSRAILELYEHYLELMPILTCRSESLGLVLYDANGYLLLPDGRE